MTPCDSYGNAGASGGRFAAELVPEDDESAPAIPCQVTESTRGQCLAILGRTPCVGLSVCNRHCAVKGLPTEPVTGPAVSHLGKGYLHRAPACMG